VEKIGIKEKIGNTESMIVGRKSRELVGSETMVENVIHKILMMWIDNSKICL